MKKRLIASATAFLIGMHCIQPTTAQSLPNISEVSGDYLPPANFIVPKGYNGIVWRYVTSPPASNWNLNSGSSVGWFSGRGGFYDGGTEPGDEATTPFNNNLWLRGTVTLNAQDVSDFMLWGRWDDQIEVYINGILAATKTEWAGNYQYVPISLNARNALVAGPNLIAVKVQNTGDPGFFDMGIARFPTQTTGYVKNPAFKTLAESIRTRTKRSMAPGTAVSVARRKTNGDIEILYSTGHGYMDKGFTRPVPQDAIFRLASTDKSITFAALIKMITGQVSRPNKTCNPGLNLSNPDALNNPANPSQKLNCGSLVYPIMHALGVAPATPSVDGELDDITISHLLNFQDNLVDRPDQATSEVVWDEYYTPLGIQPNESSPDTLMEFYFTTPTQTVPASPGMTEYNSNGAAVARYIIDVASPNGILDYIRNELYENSPIKDIHIAHERVPDRVLDVNGNLREPWYRTLREPWDFWIGLEDALAFASSSEALVMGFPLHPTNQDVHWGRGAMAGSNSAVDQDALITTTGTIFMAWVQSQGTPTFDEDFAWLRSTLLGLSASAWAPVTGRISHTQSGSCIHPSGGSSTPADGTRAVLWNSCADEPRLNFAFSKSFGLKQVSSGKCLHPDGGSANPANGTRVIFHQGCDESRLDFKVMLSGELKHIPSGKCVKPTSTSNGAELYLTICNPSDASMKFNLGNVAL